MRVMKTTFPAIALTALAVGATPASMPVAQGFVESPQRVASAAGGSGASPHGDCAQLTQLRLADVKITEAVRVPAGNSAIKVAHCRVAGVIGTEIKFSLLLPDDWNRKFLMGGGGGFVGSVQNQAQLVN